MKFRNRGLLWAVVLFLIGLFLLLKNLSIFGPWGNAVWGGLVAAIGLGFLAWFLVSIQQWWRAIPGFILLSAGALVLLDWRGVQLGDWRGALLLFGIALGFWAILLVHVENWWALVPAGVTTLLGLLVGLQGRVGPAGSTNWLAALFVGLGIVFALLYFLRLGRRDTRWSAIPAVALILVGVTTLTESSGSTQLINRWWPVLLLAGGLGLLVTSLPRRTAPVAAPAPAAFDAILPAKGASVTQTLPEAPVPTVRQSTPVSAEKPVEGKPLDIYEVLAQQPSEEPPSKPEQPSGPSESESK